VQRISRVDCSFASFLPLCPQCTWRGLPRVTRDEASAVADRHAVQVHGDDRARAAIRQRDARLVAAR